MTKINTKLVRRLFQIKFQLETEVGDKELTAVFKDAMDAEAHRITLKLTKRELKTVDDIIDLYLEDFVQR